VNKLHGPTRYPIVGTDLSYVFLKRTGKLVCTKSLSLPQFVLSPHGPIFGYCKPTTC
jgi:hypothetical protein